SLVGMLLLDRTRRVDAADPASLLDEPAGPGKAGRERVDVGGAQPSFEIVADRPERWLPEDVDSSRAEAFDIPGRDSPDEPEVDPDAEPGEEACDLSRVLV